MQLSSTVPSPSARSGSARGFVLPARPLSSSSTAASGGVCPEVSPSTSTMSPARCSGTASPVLDASGKRTGLAELEREGAGLEGDLLAFFGAARQEAHAAPRFLVGVAEHEIEAAPPSRRRCARPHRAGPARRRPRRAPPPAPAPEFPSRIKGSPRQPPSTSSIRSVSVSPLNTPPFSSTASGTTNAPGS